MGKVAALAALAAGFLASFELFKRVGGDTFFLRPPGAGSEEEYLARCIRCGKCVAACPYKILKVAGDGAGVSAGTPHFIAREGSCKLCPDFPCVEVCPTGALSGIVKRSDVRIGTAVINRELCIALKGFRCEVCYRVCPLKEEAISINHLPRQGDNIHVIFEPVINSEKCVGCGICEERCVISDPVLAIRVTPHAGINEAYW